MKKNYKIVERYKAEKILRFANAIIDSIFTYILVVIVYLIAVLIYSLVTGTDFTLNADAVSEMDPLMDRLITSVLFAFFMFLIEFITKGRSLGKLITGTMVVNENGGYQLSMIF